MNDKNQMMTRMMEMGGGLKVRGALNPVLWLYALTSSSMIGGAIFLPKFSLIFIVALMIVLATALGSYIYLLLSSPNRLQSEEYQIRRFSMEIEQEKGDLTPRYVDHESIIENPTRLISKSKPEGGNDA